MNAIMNAPRFSVIIPTYNRASHLRGVIESVLRQTEKSFEMIIVDDGSTDNTLETVQPYLSDDKIRYIKQENKERGAARNHGAAVARGQYLNFFDSDDVMYDNHLQSAALFLNVNPAAVFFHTCYNVTDESGKTIAVERGEPDYVAHHRLIKTNYLSCDSVFVKKEVFEQVKFSEDRALSTAEDWDLWLRLISRVDLLRCNDVTFEIRNHGGRSLFTIPPARIAERDKLLYDKLITDPLFLKKFGADRGRFRADLHTFSALAFSLSKGGNTRAVEHLMQALQSSPAVLGSKRFWASLKHTILTR